MLRIRTLVASAALVSSAMVGALATTAPVSAAATTTVPSRILDTRNGIGAAARSVGPGDVIRLPAPASALSAGATSLVVNVTATDALDSGYVTIWSCDQAKPATSNLNFVPGVSVPNMAIVRPSTAAGSNATICLEASERVHLLVDVMGWFTGTNDVTTAPPNRVLDTRQTANPLRQGEFRRVRVGGTAGVPAGAQAALLNVTVTNPQRGGYLSVVPCPAGGGGASPGSSTANFQTGDTVAAFNIAALVGDDVCLFSDSNTDVIVDTFGWSSSANGLRLKAPERVLDNRNGIWSTGPARSGEVVRVRVAGRGGLPNESAAALLTVTVADASSQGYVTAWSCDTAQPTASVLNYWPGAVRANSVLVGLSGATGELCLTATSQNGSPVSLIADAVGWVPGTASRPPVPAPPAPAAPAAPATPTAPAAPSAPAAPAATNGRFGTLPVGAALPSGAQCASAVRPTAEVRVVNQSYNTTRGTRANATYPRVDGNFVGTTDEILQWAACKWGIDEDVVRAQIAKESWWQMTTVGDGGESFGLGQVRTTAHQSAFVDDNAKRSSAYNVDYTYAVWRACYEGQLTWLNTVERGATYGSGDLQGCLGVWFSGRWYTQPAKDYIAAVDGYRVQRIWETPNFRNG